MGKLKKMKEVEKHAWAISTRTKDRNAPMLMLLWFGGLIEIDYTAGKKVARSWRFFYCCRPSPSYWELIEAPGVCLFWFWFG
jgi:predicted GNAT superfamily acetyltransferase